MRSILVVTPISKPTALKSGCCTGSRVVTGSFIYYYITSILLFIQGAIAYMVK